MAKPKTCWTPAKINSMQRRAARGDKLREIAEDEGVSIQRISQLIGPIRHSKNPSKQVVKLAKAEKTDAQIAKKLGLSVAWVGLLRNQAGIKYQSGPQRHWTKERILESDRLWYERYGYVATSNDWNPALAIRVGTPERAERFYQSDVPSVKTVQVVFGSWSNMRRRSGLKAQRGSFRNAKR